MPTLPPLTRAGLSLTPLPHERDQPPSSTPSDQTPASTGLNTSPSDRPTWTRKRLTLRHALLVASLLGILLGAVSGTGLAMSATGSTSTTGSQSLSPVHYASTNTTSPCHDLNNNSYGWTQHYACVQTHLYKQNHDLSIFPKDATHTRQAAKNGKSASTIENWLFRYYRSQQYADWWSPSKKQIQQTPKLQLYPLTKKTVSKYETNHSLSVFPKNARGVRFEATHGASVNDLHMALLNYNAVRWDQGWRPNSGSSTTTTAKNTTAAGAAPGSNSNAGSSQNTGGSSSQASSNSTPWYAPYLSGIVHFTTQFRDSVGGLQNFINGLLIWSLKNPVIAGAVVLVLLALVMLFGFLRRIRRTWTAMLALWSRFVRGVVWVTDTLSVGTIRRAQIRFFRLRRTVDVYGHASVAAAAWALRRGFHHADVKLTDYVTDENSGAWSYIAPPAYESASIAADVAVSKTTYAKSNQLLDPLDAPAVKELDEDEPPRPGDDLWYRITASDTPASPETIAKQVEGLPNLTDGLNVIIRSTPPSMEVGEEEQQSEDEDESRLAIELLIHFNEDGQTSTLDRTKHNRVRQAFGGPDYDVTPVSTTLQRLLRARPYRQCKYLLGNDAPSTATFPWSDARASKTATDGGNAVDEEPQSMSPTERATTAAAIPRRHFREHLEDQFNAVCPEPPVSYPIGSRGTRRWDFLQRLNVFDETAAENAPPMEAVLDALLETDEPAVLRAQVSPAGDLSDLVRQKTDVVEGEESTQFDKRTNRRGRSHATPSSGEDTTEEERAAARERESGRVRGEVASAEGTRNEELQNKGATRSFKVTMDVFTQPTPFLNDALEDTAGGTVGTPTVGDSDTTTPSRSAADSTELDTADTASDGGVVTEESPRPTETESTRDPPVSDTVEEFLASRGDTLRVTPETLADATASQRTTARDDAWRLAKTWATAADGEFNKLTEPPTNSRLAKWARSFGFRRHTLGRLRDTYRFHRAQEYAGRSPTLGLHYSMRRRWPVVIAAADELPSFTALPSTGAVSDDLAAHMERQLSHTAPLSELSPAEDNEIIGEEVNGATLGYAFNRLHARDLSRPVKHRTDYMDRSILHQGLPGSGKSVDQANEIIERRKATNGPIIVYAGPGANVGELAVRGLLEEFGEDWVREHVQWFDMPEVLPGLTVFDTRPAQQADESHGNPEVADSVATDETQPQRPAVAEEDTSWETHGSQVMQTVRKIAELLMGESDFQNARVSRDVLRALGTAGFSPHTYPTGVDGTPAYKRQGGNSSANTLPTADDLVNGRSHSSSDDEDDDNSWTPQPATMPFRWGYDASPHVYPLWQFQEQTQQVTELTKLMDPDVPSNPKAFLPDPGSHAVKRNMETPFNNQQHTAQQIIGGVTNRLNALTTDARLAPLFNNTTRRFSFADFLAGDRKNDVLIFDVEDLDPDAQRDFILTHELLMQYELELYKSFLKEEATADEYYVSVFIDEAGRLVEPDDLAKMIAVARNHSVSLSLAVQTPDQLMDADNDDSLGDAPTYAEIVANIQTTVVRAGEIDYQQAKALCPAGLEVEDFIDHVRDLPVDHRLIQYPTPSEGTRSQTIEVARIPLPKWHQDADEAPEGYDSREDFEETFHEVRADVIDRTNEEYGIPDDESESAVRNRAILNVPELAHHLTIDDPLLPVILAWATWLVARDPPEGPGEEVLNTSTDTDTSAPVPDAPGDSLEDSPTEALDQPTGDVPPALDGDVAEDVQPNETSTNDHSPEPASSTSEFQSDSVAANPTGPPFDTSDTVLDEWKQAKQARGGTATTNDTHPREEEQRTATSPDTPSSADTKTPTGLKDALEGDMTAAEWDDLTTLIEKGTLTPREWAIHTDLPTFGEDDQSMQARALNSRVANLINQNILTKQEVARIQELVDTARDTGNWPPSTVQARLETTDGESPADESVSEQTSSMSTGGVSAAIERRRTSDSDTTGFDPFDGTEPRPGTYRWVRLDEMYRRLRLEVEKVLSAEGLNEGERNLRRRSLPSLKACADEVEALGTVMTHRGVAGDSPIPETEGIFEIELAKHRDDVPGDDGYAVRLTPEGARLLLENVFSTGWVATAGTDTHDTGLRDAVTALEDAAPTRVSGRIIDQDTGGIPDAEATVFADEPTACFADEIISCTVEEETEPRHHPTKKLRNLRKALNATTKSGECRLPIFVAETPWNDEADGPDLGPATALSNILADPMNTQWSGRRFYTQRNTPIEFDGGARDGGVTAVVPRPDEDVSRSAVWVRDPDPDSNDCLLVDPTADDVGHPDEEDIQLRIAPGDFQNLTPSSLPCRATCPPGSANKSARYIVETPGSEDTYKYETEEQFREEWARVNKPFVPDIEFRYPDYPETSYAILARYEPRHAGETAQARIAWFDHRTSSENERGTLRPVEDLIEAIQTGELKPASAGPGETPKTDDEDEASAESSPEPVENGEETGASSSKDEESTAPEESTSEPAADASAGPADGEEDASNDDLEEAKTGDTLDAPQDGGIAATAAFVEAHLRPASNNLVDFQVAYDYCQEYARAHNLVPPASKDEFEEAITSLFDAFDEDTGIDGDLFDVDKSVLETLEEGLQVVTTTNGPDSEERTVLFDVRLVDPDDDSTSFLTSASPEKSAGVAAYVSSQLASDPEGKVATTDTYDHYAELADQWNFEALNDRGRGVTFPRAIQMWGAAFLGVAIERKRRRLNGDPTQCYLNIARTDDTE